MSTCIGTCELNEDDFCIGCDRHITEIISQGLSLKDINYLADGIEAEEHRRETLSNGLLAFLRKDPTHPLYNSRPLRKKSTT